MNKKEIIALLEKAIKESGKSFSDIPKESIIDFIRRGVGPNQKLINEIFLEMATKATNSVPKGVTGKKGWYADKSQGGVTGKKGWYADKSQGASASSTEKVVNEPKKSPRKSVFSEIKKIT